MNFRSKGLVYVVGLGCIAGAAMLILWLRTHQKLGRPGLKLDLPARVLDYESKIIKVTDEEIGTLPKDTTFGRRLYSRVKDGQTNHLQLGVVLMGSDRTSLHKPQFCLVGQGWRIDKTEKVNLPVNRPRAYPLPLMKLTASKIISADNGQPVPIRALYAYWFVAEDRLTADHWRRMWWMAKHLLLTGVLQRWAYVSCFAVCYPGREEETFAEMQRFLAAAVPDFQLTTGSR